MSTHREDIRTPDPQDNHRAAFLAGWTEAVKGNLYKTVLEKKTYTNIGNIFGWIYGERPDIFRLETWYRYLNNAGKD